MAIKRFDQELLTKIVKQTDTRYAKGSDLQAVEKKIEDIVSEGGEPNTIENIKVNGVLQEIVDKVVDILVPTKVGDLENDAGYQTGADVAAAVAEIVASAPEDFDTLKEIADWITNHADSAATMNSQIQTNKQDISDLAALVGKLPEGVTATTVIDYITEAIADMDLSAYLKESDFEEMTDAEIEAAFAAADED